MKIKNYVQSSLLFLVLLHASFSRAQVEVNQDSDVGIKASTILDYSSLTVENQENLQTLNAVYNYSGSASYPTNTVFNSTVNATQLFRTIHSTTRNNGSGIAQNINSFIQSQSTGQVIGINNTVTGAQQPYSGTSYYEKIGIVNNITSTISSGEDRTGLYNLINGEGDGRFVGVKSTVSGDGIGPRVGMQNSIQGTGSGGRRGMQNNVSGFVDGPYSGNNTKYGILNYVDGVTNGTDSDEARIGLYNQVFGDGNGDFQGVRNQVYGNGNGDKYGLLNSIYGEGEGRRTALRNIVNGGGSGLIEGISNEVKGTGTGQRMGINNIVSGYMVNDPSVIKYGIFNSVKGAASNVPDSGEKRVGIENKVTGDGSGPKVGIQSTVEGSANEDRIGILNDIYGSGNGVRRGLQNVVAGGGDDAREGINNQVRGSGAADRTGIWNRVYQNGSGEYIGIENIVEGDNGTAVKIGINNRVVSMNSTNAVAFRSEMVGVGLAGEFLGDVEVDGKLTIQDVINLTALSSPPAAASTGDIYLDDGTNTGGSPKLRYYNGSTWINL